LTFSGFLRTRTLKRFAPRISSEPWKCIQISPVEIKKPFSISFTPLKCSRIQYTKPIIVVYFVGRVQQQERRIKE